MRELVILIGLPGAVALWWLPWPWFVRLPVFLAALVLWSILFDQRGRVCGHAFAKTLLVKNNKTTRLSQLRTLPQHVISIG